MSQNPFRAGRANIAQRIWSFLLALAMLFPSGISGFAPAVMAAGPSDEAAAAAEAGPAPVSSATDNTRYFYNQLQPNAKKIYDALLVMAGNGLLEKGNSDMDMANFFDQPQIDAYWSNPNSYLQDYGAARDAFEYDHPEVFYVDYDDLSVRMDRKSGTAKAYLGIGRKKEYLVDGFDNERDVQEAKAIYEAKVEEYVNAAREAGENAAPGMALREMITTAHDCIVNNMIYRYEDECGYSEKKLAEYKNEPYDAKREAKCNHRSAYDALINQEGVCQSYTRAFQDLMNRLGVPCVSVHGAVSTTNGNTEEHIWNYVSMDGGTTWLGVDCTHDDPTNDCADFFWRYKYHETHKYLLKPASTFLADRMPSGILSPANYEFTYPVIANVSGETAEEDQTGRLKVVLSKDLYQEGEDGWFGDENELMESGTFMVSYRGKNYTENAKDGYYILFRGLNYGDAQKEGLDENTDWELGSWGYIQPELYGMDLEPDLTLDQMKEKDYEDYKLLSEQNGTPADTGEGSFVMLPFPHVKRCQFAVTTIPPKYEYYKDKTYGKDYGHDEMQTWLTYTGDESALIDVTKQYDNQWGNYIRPPYPESNTPGYAEAGKETKVTLMWDEELVPSDGGEPDLSVEFSAPDQQPRDQAFTEPYGNGHANGFELVKDGSGAVKGCSFNFQPSNREAHNRMYYSFSIKNMVGKYSKRKPLPITYVVNWGRCPACYRCVRL